MIRQKAGCRGTSKAMSQFKRHNQYTTGEGKLIHEKIRRSVDNLTSRGKNRRQRNTITNFRGVFEAGAGRYVQKMDKRPFSRVANNKFTSGFYVNFIFDLEPSNLAQLRHRFALNEEVFRVLFTFAPAVTAVAPVE